MMPFGSFWCALILLTLILAASPAPAQAPAPTTFPSESKSVTIERFDPKTAGSHPAVMVIHGGGGAQGDWRKSGLLEALTGAGYIAFVPHYFEGTRGNWTRSANTDQLIAYIRTLNDAAALSQSNPACKRTASRWSGFLSAAISFWL